MIVYFPPQRWIYRIDPKRINEYGQVLPEDGKVIETVDDKESKKKR